MFLVYSMYVCMYVCVCVHVNMYAKHKNTLDVKKCEANQKQHVSRQVRPKALISAEAKKTATLSKNF